MILNRYATDFDGLVFSKISGYTISAIMFAGLAAVPIGGQSVLPVAYFIVGLLFLCARFHIEDIKFLFRLFFCLYGIFLVQVIVGVPPQSNFVRIFLGTTLLFLAVFICSKMLDWSSMNGHKWLFRGLRFFFWLHFSVQLILVIAAIFYPSLGIGPALGSIPRSAGILQEASTLGVVFAPLGFIAVLVPDRFASIMGRKTHIFLWISLLFLGVSASNFVVPALALIIKIFHARKFRAIFAFVFAMFFIATLISYSPGLQARFFGVLYLITNDGNLQDLEVPEISVMIFAKGAETAGFSITHYPLGVGSLNFSSVAPFSELVRIFPILLNKNDDDGSSLFFKGIGEFGIFYIIFMIVAFFQIKIRLKHIEYDDNALIEASFLFCIFTEIVRGGSYFTSPVIMGFAITMRHILSGGWRSWKYKTEMVSGA